MALKHVSVRADSRHLWRSEQRPSKLEFVRVERVDAPPRPHSMSFSFMSQGAGKLEMDDSDEEHIEPVDVARAWKCSS